MFLFFALICLRLLFFCSQYAVNIHFLPYAVHNSYDIIIMRRVLELHGRFYIKRKRKRGSKSEIVTDIETDGNYTRLRILLLHIIMWLILVHAMMRLSRVIIYLYVHKQVASVYWKCITSTN